MESSSLFNDLSERNLLSLEQFDVRVQIGARLVEMAQKKKKNVKEDVEKLWLAGFHAVIAHINSKEHHDDSTLDLFRRNIADAERFFVQLAKVDESLHAHCLTRRGEDTFCPVSRCRFCLFCFPRRSCAIHVQRRTQGCSRRQELVP